MNSKILISLSAILFSTLTTFASNREHKITLKGAVLNSQSVITVKDIEEKISEKSQITTTLQEEPKQKFEGVTVKNFLKAFAKPTVIKMKVTATNAYSQTLTLKDWNEWTALLAYKSDGKIISTKSRGTFRIVYDYEKYKGTPDLVTQETNSVWQIVEIEFLEK